MQPADWVIIAIIGISMVFGLMRGFVREAFSLAGWLAAFVVARVFFDPLDQILQSHLHTESVRHVAAYGALFFGTLVVAWLVGYAVMSLIDAVGLKWSDRLLGGGFGVARGLILVLAILIMVKPLVSNDEWWHEAKLPKEFMKYEFLGRTLKDKVIEVTLPAKKDDDGAAGQPVR